MSIQRLAERTQEVWYAHGRPAGPDAPVGVVAGLCLLLWPNWQTARLPGKPDTPLVTPDQVELAVKMIAGATDEQIWTDAHRSLGGVLDRSARSWRSAAARSPSG